MLRLLLLIDILDIYRFIVSLSTIIVARVDHDDEKCPKFIQLYILMTVV